MWDINESYKDITEPSGQVSIFLNADKALNPYHISYPITWSGFINNHAVEVIQLTESSSFLENYEFRVYPYGYSIYQGRIVSLIDNKLRRSLD